MCALAYCVLSCVLPCREIHRKQAVGQVRASPLICCLFSDVLNVFFRLTPVHDHIYCCRSGSAADTQAVADMVRYYLDLHRYSIILVICIATYHALAYSMQKGEEPEVKTAAELFRKICYSNKSRLMAGIIVGGWDEYLGGQVYCIPLGGAMVRQPFSIGGRPMSVLFIGLLSPHAILHWLPQDLVRPLYTVIATRDTKRA